jgi:FKBP-type peptidyl-prolyl cis-trans isomerase FklB
MTVATFAVRAEDKTEFKDEKEKASYALGLNLANGWKRNDVDLDVDAIARGMKDVFSGATQRLSSEDIQATLMKYQQELQTKQQEKRKVAGEKNKVEGEKFLVENKNKPGIETLPSGLQYKVIKEGSGDSPKATDTVSVNYRGSLIDGTVFDQSPTNQPATFRVNGVIAGWTEALQLMKPGSKWQLFIPSDLAYKEYGSGQKIGPNAALIFDVELVSVKPAPPPVQPQPITSDIIKVPSAEEMKKGAKIETIKPEDVQKEIEKERARTNQPKN